MKVAVWNLPPADLLTSGLSSGEFEDRFDVQRLLVPDCERVLREGHVDIALVPTLSVLKAYKDFDVVPAVAFSTWRYPFARLVLEHDLRGALRTVAYHPDHEQERLIAEIVLREHYKKEPEFVSQPATSNASLLEVEADGKLLVGADVPTMPLPGTVLDLGQEWFELANYPMTWGLFAARKDTLDPDAIRTLRDGVRASERQRKVWLRARETSSELHAFYSDGLRFRLDDLCIAGLTEFRQFLFYYDVVDDVRDIPFVFLPDDEEDHGRKPLL